jgi:hypothetical protein
MRDEKNANTSPRNTPAANPITQEILPPILTADQRPIRLTFHFLTISRPTKARADIDYRGIPIVFII